MTHTQSTPAEVAYRKVEEALRDAAGATKYDYPATAKRCKEALALLPALKPHTRPEPAPGNVRMLRDEYLDELKGLQDCIDFFDDGSTSEMAQVAYSIINNLRAATESAAEQPDDYLGREDIEALLEAYDDAYRARLPLHAIQPNIDIVRDLLTNTPKRESGATEEAGKGVDEAEIRKLISEAIRAPKFGKYSSGEPHQIDCVLKAIRPYLRQPLTPEAREKLVGDVSEAIRKANNSSFCDVLCLSGPCPCADAYAQTALTIAEKALLGKGGQV